MNSTEQPDLITDDKQQNGSRSALGTRLLLAGSALYAAAAVAPFTQGLALDTTTARFGDGPATSTSYWGEGAFDFIWHPIGWTQGNGGMFAHLQALTVLAMALVAIGAVVRLRRGRSQRSIASIGVTGMVTLLLAKVWTDVSKFSAIESYGLAIAEEFRFTPSLVVASIAAVIAAIGAVMAASSARVAAQRG